MSDVSDRVVFIPNLSVDAVRDLSALYTSALCYIQPSLYEGFGLPVLEAMQCKTPVVSSNTPALLEITSNVALNADPVAEKLAEQVQVVLNWSQQTRKAAVQKAYDWSQNYSWDKVAKETAEIYFKSLE